MSTTPVAKREMRLRVRQLLTALSPAERHAKSKLIQAKLISSLTFQAAQTVAAYASFGTEVETDAVLADCLSCGKELLLSRMNSEQVSLTFHRVHALGDLETNAFGIREPRANVPEVSLDTVEFLLVPGIAFSESGERLGRGAGYYDRILARVPVEACSMALAFDVQVFPAGYFETEAHDRRVQGILTEAREIALG